MHSNRIPARIVRYRHLNAGLRFIRQFENNRERVESVEREQVTHIMMVPAQIIALLQSPNFSQQSMQSMEMLLTIGAPLQQQYKEAVNAVIPGRFYELYGLTEGFVTILDRNLPPYIIVPLIFIAGFIGGALWGIIPAILKIKFSINEVISTLMLNYICAEILTMLIVGPWKGKQRFGFPGTNNLPDSAILGIIPGSRIHYVTLILAILCAVVLCVVVYKTRFGYEARVVGENPDAGKYAGINFLKTSVIIMAISGGFAGLAGVGEIAGIHHYLGYPASVSSGYGFTAIIVAWLAKLNPLYAIVSGIFFAGILVGGDAIQISLGLPAATVQIVNGTLLIFLIMGDYFLKNKIRFEMQ